MRTDGDALHKADSLRADVVALLREKRYEEALAVLYRARSDAPADPELQRSIEQVKEFLIGAYAKRLGGLDRIATPVPRPAVRSPDAVLLARYIDGTSTIGDVAQMCPLGKLRTLQVLVGLYSGTEPPRIDLEPPPSGLRVPEVARDLTPPEFVTSRAEGEERPPDTARSSSGTTQPFSRLGESEDSRSYKQSFELGTAAFVQRRYKDAIEAFETCVRLRPDDKGALALLRRSVQGLASE